MKYTDTTVRKGYHGWKGETTISVNGKDWQITTLKRSNGLISTVAQSGKLTIKDGVSIFSFVIFQDPIVRLNSVKSRATIKTVGDIHTDGLEKFESYINNI